MEEYKILEREFDNGVQKIYKFDNRYGASVIRHDFSYGSEQGLWELAVMTFNETGGSHICYSTDITDDVLGYLTDEDVLNTLEQIKAL